MKRLLLPLLLALVFSGCNRETTYQPRGGDIIFQISKSAQSEPIQLATKSKYSHLGIVYVENGQTKVFEAVGPVKSTPLADWIRRGENEHYVVKRLIRADELLKSPTLKNMKKIGEEKYLGQPYDQYFQWSDEKIYCSELVWKVFQEAVGIEVGELQTLGGYDWSHPKVQELMQERYGGSPPAEEPAISPGGIFNSDLLVTVFENR